MVGDLTSEIVRVWYMYRRMIMLIVLFQAEDGIRDLVRSRGLGDVYKRQRLTSVWSVGPPSQKPG